MAAHPLIILPDPLLKRVSAPVEAVTDDIRTLMDDMLETMYAAPGIGLAAIQIGVPKRVVVMDLVKDEEKPPAAAIFRQSGDHRRRGGNRRL